MGPTTYHTNNIHNYDYNEYYNFVKQLVAGHKVKKVFTNLHSGSYI